MDMRRPSSGGTPCQNCPRNPSYNLLSGFLSAVPTPAARQSAVPAPAARQSAVPHSQQGTAMRQPAKTITPAAVAAQPGKTITPTAVAAQPSKTITPAAVAAQPGKTITPAAVAAQPTAAPQAPRVHYSAYASGISLEIKEGKALLPLERQRAEGKFEPRGGAVVLPASGYYMILWEADFTESEGAGTLNLFINDAAAQLTEGLQPGYESGQQVTWLCAGDTLALGILAEQPAKALFGNAQLTIIRLG